MLQVTGLMKVMDVTKVMNDEFPHRMQLLHHDTFLSNDNQTLQDAGVGSGAELVAIIIEEEEEEGEEEDDDDEEKDVEAP